MKTLFANCEKKSHISVMKDKCGMAEYIQQMLLLFIVSVSVSECFDMKVFDPTYIKHSRQECTNGLIDKSRIVYTGYVDYESTKVTMSQAETHYVSLEMASSKSEYSSFKSICDVYLGSKCKKPASFETDRHACYCSEEEAGKHYNVVFNLTASPELSQNNVKVQWLNKTQDKTLDEKKLGRWPEIYAPDQSLDTLTINGMAKNLSDCHAVLNKMKKNSFRFCAGGSASNYLIDFYFINHKYSRGKRSIPCYSFNVTLKRKTKLTDFVIKYAKDAGCTRSKQYTCAISEEKMSTVIKWEKWLILVIICIGILACVFFCLCFMCASNVRKPVKGYVIYPPPFDVPTEMTSAPHLM